MDLLKFTLEEINKSPIYAMSLSAKELFHSNFWKWLIEHNSEYAKIFFGEIDLSESISVQREYCHTDLTIHVGKGKNEKLYVIENKFKSYPDSKQLETYEKKLAKMEKGCLTYLIEPTFKEFGKWSHKSYEKVLEEIYLKSNNENDPYIKHIIQEYCKIFLSLIHIISHELRTDKKLSLNCSSKALKLLRVHDVYSKLKAAEFKSFFEASLPFTQLNKKIDGFELECFPDYSTNSANLTIKYQKRFENKDQIQIGIQIQSNLIRHYISIDKENCNVVQKRFELYERFADLNWFDKNYEQNSKEITLINKSHNTNMNPTAQNRRLFNAFKNKTGKGIFIHHHYLCNNLSKEDACKLFADTMKYIYEHKLHTELEVAYKQL